MPFEDKKANELIFKFIPDLKPDYIYILGDLIDFWQVSKFLKDPSRKNDIQKDIDAGREYLKKLRELSPEAEISLHFGNHLTRLKKYIWRQAQELSSLRSLDLRWMLDCDNLKIKTIEEEEGYEQKGKLVLTHGTVVSQDSGMTARRNLQKYGISVICGHTHRLSAIFKTDLRGMIGSWENGCLCDLNLIKMWGREVANWQTAFSIIYFHENFFVVRQIPIIKNSFIFGDKIYE